MEQFISIFLPAFVALKLFDHLHHNKLDLKDLIIYYGIFVILIRYSAVLMTRYVFDLESYYFGNVFSIKYITVALIMAVLIPLFVSLVLKAITINISIKSNNKTKK